MAHLPGVGNGRNIAVAVGLVQKLLDKALLTLAALFPSRGGLLPTAAIAVMLQPEFTRRQAIHRS
jgi:hypothetical protein